MTRHTIENRQKKCEDAEEKNPTFGQHSRKSDFIHSAEEKFKHPQPDNVTDGVGQEKRNKVLVL